MARLPEYLTQCRGCGRWFADIRNLDDHDCALNKPEPRIDSVFERDRELGDNGPIDTFGMDG